jgi:PEP-CTERM motif
MVTIARPRVWPILLFLTAIMLVHPPSARADRIDIDDPSLLGPVLLSDFIYDFIPLERALAEVRYDGGIYSYVYAVSSTPYFPSTACCEAGMVSFAVTGHPLEDTWGAIYSSDVFWSPDDDNPPRPTAHVSSISPIFDGFRVVSQPGTGSFAVVYMQSPLPPSGHGILTYTGRVRDFDHDPEGIVRIESFQKDGVLVPTPEPGTIGLFGLGLASLAAKLRANRHRWVARPR